MTEESIIKKETEEIYNNLQKTLEKDDYHSTIDFAKKTLELRPYDVRVQLFIADVLYKWGKNLEEKKDPESKEKFKQAFNLYDMILQKHPNIFYLSHAQNRKLECSKKRW